MTGDIHTFFAGDVTRTGRQTVRGEDDTDPVNGPSRATEFVGGAITSPGIVDRAASTRRSGWRPRRRPTPRCWPTTRSWPTPTRPTRATASSRPAAGRLGVRYQAVHEQRAPDSGVFTLRRFRVDSGRPVVIDEGGPAPIELAGVADRHRSAQSSSASTCAAVRPAAGSVVTSRVGAAREDAHARHESSWASSIQASGAIAGVGLDRVELPVLRCAVLRGEGEERQRSGQD